MVNETEIKNCIHMTKQEVTLCINDLLSIANPNSPCRRGGWVKTNQTKSFENLFSCRDLLLCVF